MAIPRGGNNSLLSKHIDRRTVTKAPIENIAENTPLANKSPGALAGATGADEKIERGAHYQYTQIDRPSAIQKWVKDRHKRVSRAIGYTLALGFNQSRADGLSLIFAARLSEGERAAIAYSALNSLSEEHAYQIASLAVFGTLHGRAAA